MSRDGLSISRYTRRDVPEWIRLRKELWPDCSTDIQSVGIRLVTEHPERATVIVLGHEDGTLHGFAELSVRERVDGAVSEKVGYLEGWYIEPQFRGMGWGRKLIAAAEEWVVEKGLTELASDAELGNEPAILAHRALGFKETFRVVRFLKNIRS